MMEMMVKNKTLVVEEKIILMMIQMTRVVVVQLQVMNLFLKRLNWAE